MKLLIYSHAFAPSVGGVEALVMLLAQGLARQAAGSDLQITVVTLTPAGKGDDVMLPFRVVRQPGFATLVGLLWRTDVIHLAGPAFLPMLIGWFLRKPVVVEHSGYQAVCPNGLLLDERTKTVCPGHFMARRYGECMHCNAAAVSWWKSLRMLLLTFPRRWMCRKVARNVFPSNHINQRVRLPHGVCVHHGAPDPPPTQKLGAQDGSGPTCFAFVGRLVWEKGVEVMLAAAQKLMASGHDFRLRIIGDGPDRPRLEEMTDRFGLRSRTVFAGFLHGEALQEAMDGASVALLPSVCEEVAGLAAVEHMLQGRLVIASDIGGMAEYVDGVGLKFPSRDVEGLASCLQRVLDEPSLATMLGEKARERALQLFRQDRMVEEHLDLYRQLAPQ